MLFCSKQLISLEYAFSDYDNRGNSMSDVAKFL